MFSITPWYRLWLSICQIHCDKIGFRSGSSCYSAITVLRETVFRYVSEGRTTNCALIDVWRAIDQTNHKVSLEWQRETSLHKQVQETLGYKHGNNFSNVVFDKTENESWQVRNGNRHRYVWGRRYSVKIWCLLYVFCASNLYLSEDRSIGFA